MQQESHIIDYAKADAEPVSAQKALLSCTPGLLALVTYATMQFETPQGVPVIILYLLAYLFWPLLAIGVLVGAVCFGRFRRRYRGRKRPWFVSVSIAVHTLVLLVGVPFLSLVIAGLLAGNY
jgi:hypothetical protein